VLKAGGAYLPLDPAYPEERLRYMVADSGTVVLLTQGELAGTLTGTGRRLTVIDLEAETPAWLDHSECNPDRSLVGLRPEHVAYVIYTSGSTGKPKGVMATHGGLSNYMAYAVRSYLGAEVQGSVVSSPLSFDATLTTLLPPLLEGKTVELLPEDETTIGRLAERLFGGAEGQLFKITPAHLEGLEYVERSKGVGQGRHRVVIGECRDGSKSCCRGRRLSMSMDQPRQWWGAASGRCRMPVA
jgi:non-ribosomal peptide synthetase component F